MTLVEQLRGKARRMDVWLDRVAEGGGVAPTREEIEESDLAREAASRIVTLEEMVFGLTSALELSVKTSEQRCRDHGCGTPFAQEGGLHGNSR